MSEQAHLLTTRVRESIHDLTHLPISDDLKIDALLEIEQCVEADIDSLLPEDDEPVDRTEG